MLVMMPEVSSDNAQMLISDDVSHVLCEIHEGKCDASGVVGRCLRFVAIDEDVGDLQPVDAVNW